MNAVFKIIKYTFRDVVRSRWVIGFVAFFLLVTEALVRFGGGPKAVLSLTNVVLGVVPLVAITFGTMYMYNGRPFLETLLSQPVRRLDLFRGLFAGLFLPLAVGLALGIVLPFALRGGAGASPMAVGALAASGVALTAVFVALAFLIAVRIDDRVKGFGISLLVWLMLAIVYDGLVLLVVRLFADYPIEKGVLAMMVLNPVDLARVILLMQLDVSALMGYTGAVFQRFLGTGLGLTVALVAMALWVVVPLLLSRRLFAKKDY